MHKIFCTIALMLLFFTVKAKDIVSEIERDSIVSVIQPEKLSLEVKYDTNDVVAEEKSETENVASPKHTAGYRVLVFSDNNARTARGEAKERARLIAEQIPHLRTYVTFESPYWRLKVGDFRTHSAAESVANEIKITFPQYSREIRVVKDRINNSK